MLKTELPGKNAKALSPETATDDVAHMLHLNRAPATTYTSPTQPPTPLQPKVLLEGSVPGKQDSTNVDVDTETGRQEHLRILY